jgi:hypothetical protein
MACGNAPLYSSFLVNTNFDLTFTPCFTAAVPAGAYVIVELPFYDTGFIIEENTIACELNSVKVNCIPYKGIDWILIIAPNVATPATASIKIRALQWPRYV